MTPDRFDAGAVILSQCAYCDRWEGNARCEAFPEGVPRTLLDNTYDHREPHSGEHGLQFRLNRQVASTERESMFRPFTKPSPQ